MPDPCHRCGIDVAPGKAFCRDCAGFVRTEERRRSDAAYYALHRERLLERQAMYRARRLAS